MTRPPQRRIEPPEIAVRVPGPWEGPEEFDARLPAGYRLGSDGTHAAWLVTPEGQRLGLWVSPADEEFPHIFDMNCTREPSDEDKRGVETYRFNVCLSMPGGSYERAGAALRHTVALLDAGGHGVFVDNSGIAHGSNDWRDLANDTGLAAGGDQSGGDTSGGGGGPFWAFLTTTGSANEVWTTGMHCMGLRDAIMPRTGNDRDDDLQIRNFLAYSYRSGAVIDDGDVAGSELAPMFRISFEDDTKIPAGHPMHNPYGRYRLTPIDGDPLTPAN